MFGGELTKKTNTVMSLIGHLCGKVWIFFSSVMWFEFTHNYKGGGGGGERQP
jgi:hypothetical protein